MVLIITGDVNVTSVVPPQQRMTAQGLWSARRAVSAPHLAHMHTQAPCTHLVTNIPISPKSEPYVSSYYTHNTRDAWVFWLCSSRLLNFFFFLTDTQKYLCVKIEGLWEIREGCGSWVREGGYNTRGKVTQVRVSSYAQSDTFGFGKWKLNCAAQAVYQYEWCRYWIILDLVSIQVMVCPLCSDTESKGSKVTCLLMQEAEDCFL